MQDFNPLGDRGASSPGAPFVKYRPPRQVWREFLELWEAKHPGRAFTPRQAQRITGLPRRTVRRYLAEDAEGAAQDV